MKFKLFKKYFFIIAAIVILSFLVLMMILSVVLNNHIAKSTNETLSGCCEQISQNFSLATENENTDVFMDMARALANVSGADIFLTDSHGGVIVCACEEWEENEKCLHSSYIIPKEYLDRADSDENLQIGTMRMYAHPQYIATKLIDGEEKYYVFATSPLSDTRDLMYKISKFYYLWAIVPIGLMCIAIFVMTYRLTRPLKNMSEAAKAMAKGDFSKRIPVTSDDEIGELAVSFNMMTNSLARLEGMRKSFVGDVSHELKTPMTTISGFIDGILDGTIKSDEQEYYLNIVSQEVKRLSRLVNGMLNMARLESGEFEISPQRFDFYELLCTIVISQEQRIEKQKLEIEGLDSINNTEVLADKDLIYQVVYNLVDNAIKFTDECGKIAFKLEQFEKNIVFTITNTGKGIPEKELPFVFERFYKVDKSRSAVKNSTGLGLYLVKTIVSAHKGSICVTSKENEFTEFKVTLPKEI